MVSFLSSHLYLPYSLSPRRTRHYTVPGQLTIMRLFIWLIPWQRQVEECVWSPGTLKEWTKPLKLVSSQIIARGLGDPISTLDIQEAYKCPPGTNGFTVENIISPKSSGDVQWFLSGRPVTSNFVYGVHIFASEDRPCCCSSYDQFHLNVDCKILAKNLSLSLTSCQTWSLKLRRHFFSTLGNWSVSHPWLWLKVTKLTLCIQAPLHLSLHWAPIGQFFSFFTLGQ